MCDRLTLFTPAERVARVFGLAGERVPTCCVLTTPANGLVRHVHDRVPVVLPEGD